LATTILVVDDDVYKRELMRLHLGSAGYEVLLAEDAMVAGRLVLAQRPDIILCDVELPFMTGLEFGEAVKADPATASIPIVFITSVADAEPSARQLGAVEFLTKPLRADHLLATIAKHVDGRVPL
jgi:CheY-like chemotaxis protein